MFPKSLRSLALSAIFFGAASPLPAEIRLPHFFSDHMVLQRERAVAIWGFSDPGVRVELSFKGKQSQASADAQGYWKTTIESGPADAAGATLTITAGTDKKEVKDVLVGEVWLASGQSNMVFRMKTALGGDAFAAKANLPALRFFDAPNVTASEPQQNIEGRWAPCTPETVTDWSAVATFFAARIHRELGIPVGVIESSWGGKPIEAFISREALNTLPSTQALVESLHEAERNYDPKKAQQAHQKAMETWKTATTEAKSQGRDPGRKLRRPEAPNRPLLNPRSPGVLFDAMIHPFVGYTLRGAIWYQGEANSHPGCVPYDQTLPLLIRDWRKRWDDPFSFYYVQLANFHEPSTKPGVPDGWALVQDRMRRVLDVIPKTGMAVINDAGEAHNIHPKDKRTPGERLALWALAKDYGRDLIFSGPLFKSSTTQGKEVTITFDHVGTGLKLRDTPPLKRFEIAGEDHQWVWAHAEISGKNTVRVSSPDVPKPLAVRYAWAANPEGANLVNSEGLPASIFRTDDWSDVESTETLAKDRNPKLNEVRDVSRKLKELDPKSEEAKQLKSKLKELMRTTQPPPPDSEPNGKR